MDGLPSNLRPSSSPASSSPGRLLGDLKPTLESLKGICVHKSLDQEHVVVATEILLRLRHTFIDSERPRQVKDSFRHLDGFQLLVNFIQLVIESYNPKSQSKEDRKDLLKLFKDAVTVLAECLKGHSGNRRFFSKRLAGGGSAALEHAFNQLFGKLNHDQTNDADVRQIYGGIFAAALSQETVSDLFVTLCSKFPDDEAAISPSDIRQAIDQLLGNAETVELPELLGPFLRTWLSYSARESQHGLYRLAIPACLCQLASYSIRNAVALHSTGILSAVLSLLMDGTRTEKEKILYRELVSLLSVQGVNHLHDAVDLYRQAYDNTPASQIVLDITKTSKSPPCIQFDMSSQGYSSAELSTLGRNFPPTATPGYTLAVWARFDKFDPQSHTTLFGAFDSSQSCFLLAYLERDTRNFILQTSISGPRPSVRFKSVTFEVDQWYHICIVHRRARGTSPPRASLFINGEFVEHMKIEYPSAPSIRSAGKAPRVQAFFGTPQDLAVRLGKGVSSSRWSLASAILLDDIISDDLVAVFFHLGPRYHGNFQDCLGSFQTYRASAFLNLRNENLHPGKEEHSDIITAIRQKGSVLIPESAFLINLSPTTVLDDDDSNNVDETQLVKSLSRLAAKNLHQFTKAGGNAIAINGAIPAINDALTHSRGVFILTGDPVVSVPQSLDDASWRIGGCTAIHLSMLKAATSAESTILAVELLFEAVQDSWRNSEGMERDNGYGILALLLRDKLGFPQGRVAGTSKTSTVCSNDRERSVLAIELLRSILSFVGYNFDNPNKSMITNPLAYRVLLVDLDIWRFGEASLLQMYYSQFSIFAVESQYRRFNSRRLSRMRVNKKLLDALKGEDFTQESLDLFMPAFRSLFDSCASAELLRSLSLFITYALHDEETSKLKKKKSMRFDVRPESRSRSDRILPKFKLGVEVLRMYTDYLSTTDDLSNIKRFARAVTNKWLLYLMGENDPEVVVLATRILARLLVTHGVHYSKKFADKTCGYIIMRHRLKRWWDDPILWVICIALLLGVDVALLDLEHTFDLSEALDHLISKNDIKIAFPEMMPVITDMMQVGLKSSLKENEQKTPSQKSRFSVDRVNVLPSIISFFSNLHATSLAFRDFAATSSLVQRLMLSLFPVISGSGTMSAEEELNFRDTGLSFDVNSVVVRPIPTVPPILRTTTVEPAEPVDNNGGPLRRGSSFVLISSDKSLFSASAAHLHRIALPRVELDQTLIELPLVQQMANLILDLFTDQLLARKDFTGLGLFQKTPPGRLEHQTYFESWLLRQLLLKLDKLFKADPTGLIEPRVLTNLNRFLTHIAEAIYEGWFVDGARQTLDLTGTILEYVRRPEISSLKSVRLCNQVVNGIHSVLFRVVLSKLSDVDEVESSSFLNQLAYWQTVLLTGGDLEAENLKLLCYLLYTKLISSKDEIRLAAATLWRVVLVQKPSETMDILHNAPSALQNRLSGRFEKLVEMDDEAFLRWIDEQREDLDAFFFGTISKAWERFAHEENAKTEDSAKSRIAKRRERLKTWAQEDKTMVEAIRRHTSTFEHWTLNIHASESLKYQRGLQDQHDNFVFLWSALSDLCEDLERFGGVLAKNDQQKWRLDETEGRSRMRLRVIPDLSQERQDYQPKRKASEPPVVKANSQSRTAVGTSSLDLDPSNLMEEPLEIDAQDTPIEDKVGLDDSFEMVDDPKADFDDYEDKNRKVMRSLHRGDQVQNVSNMSRVMGLEACEGLLILGKDSIYMLDNFFQRIDGEIVNVWQAPPEERDPYVRMIAGRQSDERRSREHLTQSWKWSDLISVSKRRFLFRDVALEVFFTDGQSYLLTFISTRARDDIYGQLSAKAPLVNGSMSLSTRPEDLWRFETLRVQDEAPQSLGSKFASVFGQSSSSPATRKWMKGEMSNFHYLMLVNTLAGRSFNDLTQYPVFPWVLADYTSEELDLTNPQTFRDLSKPMGCQRIEREMEFRERYKSFAEMGDHNAPPFHYGTHYSSAMIVSSYLIRLQPFVKSYLLLQGGTFDHADRLFYSVGKTWESASRGNMSDVRELIPEFFYLPEFLVNSNKYDFGLRQNMTTSIDAVELPPWAKGDPKIFIEKHREALESPHVTANLHHWIDLVFGAKQKGEPAIEAVNVFHYLSYQGAKDVDNIADPVERMATIGIIHNFGQTPHQIFTRPHPRKEEVHRKESHLDVLAESLTRVPISLLDIEERVSSLSMKHERLLCTAAFRLNVPPNYDKYMEWGFSDGSVRFYSSDNKKLLGHFESLHVSQLSCAIFADSRTLITAGSDCTISVWAFQATGKSVDLQPQASLFGHRTPVSVLAVSRSFSTVLSASLDGQIMLWDLNSHRFIRALPAHGPVECARINDVTGNIMICRGSCISLYTLNGSRLVDQVVCETDDCILSCAFYEGSRNEWLERELLFSGHKRGVVNVWSKVTRGGRFELDLIRQLHHIDNSRDSGVNVSAGISCILPLPNMVYTGDEAGRVYEWDCIQRR